MEEQFDLPGLWSGVMNKQGCCAPGAAAQQEKQASLSEHFIYHNICLREQL